jgi:hypothetical protein
MRRKYSSSHSRDLESAFAYQRRSPEHAIQNGNYCFNREW